MNPDYLPQNKIFINMAALRHNFREVKRLAGDRQVMAIVKSDAYGHGLTPCARTLAQAGADSLGVNTIEEALTLREHGVETPIHILGCISAPDQIELLVKHDFRLFSGSLSVIRTVADTAARLNKVIALHLQVDTGLGGPGIALDEVEAAIKEICSYPNIRLLGLSTHLATSGDWGAHEQLKKFDNLCLKSGMAGLRFPQDTVLDSGGLIWHSNHPAPLVRVGLMLYGVYPGPEIGPERPDLRPAMTVMSRINYIRDLAPGDTVGYGRYFTARKPMRLAIIPFGFAQGMLRSRSNRGWALIRGRRAPQVGLIAMNASTFDVTDIPDAQVGDNVVLLGRHSTAVIKPSDLAGWCSSTPYEVLTLLGKLNPRYIEGSDYEENA